MKFFVLNGHKYYPFSEGRLNKTLFDKIVEVVSVKNEVQTTIVEQGYDIETEVHKFLWADIIIFQTPINWFSFPGIFKSYFDDVYKHGIFYGPSKIYGKGGKLTNKKYMYSLTWNSPLYTFEEFGEFYDGRGMDEVIISMHKLQQYSRLKKLPTFACNDVVKSPNIPLYLDRLEEHLKLHVFNQK